MEKHHLEYATHLDPTARGKLFLLGHWSKVEVPDPYRLSQDHHALACDIICAATDDWLARL